MRCWELRVAQAIKRYKTISRYCAPSPPPLPPPRILPPPVKLRVTERSQLLMLLPPLLPAWPLLSPAACCSAPGSERCIASTASAKAWGFSRPLNSTRSGSSPSSSYASSITTVLRLDPTPIWRQQQSLLLATRPLGGAAAATTWHAVMRSKGIESVELPTSTQPMQPPRCGPVLSCTPPRSRMTCRHCDHSSMPASNVGE